MIERVIEKSVHFFVSGWALAAGWWNVGTGGSRQPLSNCSTQNENKKGPETASDFRALDFWKV